MKLSVKLGALCAVVALLPLIVASILVLGLVSSRSHSEATEKLQSYSRAAASIYEKRLSEVLSTAQRLADDIANRVLFGDDSTSRDANATFARLQDALARAHDETGLDFFIVADSQGRIIARHNDRPAAGETLLGPGEKNLLAEKVISDGASLRNSPAAAAGIERGEMLSRLGLDQVARVRLRDNTELDEALMIEVAVPILSGSRFIGVVVTGQMLNNFYRRRPRPPSGFAASLQTPLVTEIRQTLLPGADEDGGALVAMGDAVIASSLPARAAGPDSTPEPALLGSKRDEGKSEQVFSEGGRSYRVAWQPIKSLDGTQPGAIGVALAAGEFDGATGAVRAVLFVAGLIAMFAAAAAGFLFGHTLGARLTNLTDAASRMTVGELSAAVKDNDPLMPGWLPGGLAQDEINRLASQLDRMRDSFRQAIERMRRR